MKTVDTDDADGFFEVVAGTERSQAATMTLSPGQSTGGPENRHPDADQHRTADDHSNGNDDHDADGYSN